MYESTSFYQRITNDTGSRSLSGLGSSSCELIDDIFEGFSYNSGGKIYITASGLIQQVNLDGTNLVILISTGLINPLAIRFDYTAGKMYWSDYGTDMIYRANLDGSNV